MSAAPLSALTVGLNETESELPRLRPADRRLPDRRRGDRGKDTDIATVPIAAERAVGCQFAVTEPLSAKVSDAHAAAEMEEGWVRTD
jgi:hypothetical protein